MSMLVAREGRSRLWARAIAVCLVLGLSGLPSLAQAPATFQGVVLAPDGAPAEGFRVVMKDRSGQTFTSAPSGADGSYRVEVPAGTRYAPSHVVAPDGTILQLGQVPPPLPANAGTRYRLDIEFQQAAAEEPEEEAAQTPTPETSAEPTPKAKPEPTPTPEPATSGASAKKPWWKTPGGITGIVLASGAVIAVLLSDDDDDDEPPVSPDGSN